MSSSLIGLDIEKPKGQRSTHAFLPKPIICTSLIVCVSIYLGLLVGAVAGAFVDLSHGQISDFILIREINRPASGEKTTIFTNIYFSVVLWSAVLLSLTCGIMGFEWQSNQYGGTSGSLIRALVGGGLGFVGAILIGAFIVPQLVFGVTERVTGLDLYRANMILATHSMPPLMILGMLLGFILPYMAYFVIRNA
ncbi:MAG: hypothetical protein JSV05_09050 [Candidatus Bathyarchaeota archaeon]|nr:MAG: hypothetical protein JSV05_09050 [Candidatus Bathyarchaeota archaeon]